jgi:predicted nucleic acid-binding Zn ribbon protein
MPDPAQPHHFSRLAEELIGDLRGLPETPKGGRNLEGRRPDPRRAENRDARPLAGLMESLLVKYRIGIETAEQTIRDRWPEIVGPAAAHYSHAATIDERGKLTVLVSHSVVRNELFHHRKPIVERIQRLPGCAHVRALLLRAG